MFGVLDRYIGKTIFNTIMMTLFMLVSLSGIIKFVDQLRKVGRGDYTALGAGLYTLLSVPKDIEIFFPMAALLGALLGLGTLATRSELMVMQASGFTRLQIAGAVMKTAIPLVLLTMAIGEWISPAGEQMARNYRSQMMYGGSMLSTQNGLWAKDGNDFIYIERVVGDKELAGVNIYQFDPEQKLLSVRYAASAEFDDDAKLWRLSQVDESDLRDGKQISGSQTISGEWKTTLTPDKLGVVALDPDSLSIRGLYDYINYLKQSGQEAGRYKLNMWNKTFAPLSVAVMMLMALSFIFGPLRNVPAGVRIVTGISFGFLFYMLDKVFGQLSLVYGLPPVLGALVPSLLFMVISLLLLLKRR
ncbi:MAG: LPS export ABC transporter permease LptG [Symbiopectobacterium sp.]|uniref:LPS export ABC transporter permease LptG n=1 Tax=Symbiopectobacterium sp. TaxID=2952789 RepID=UPI0039E9F383